MPDLTAFVAVAGTVELRELASLIHCDQRHRHARGALPRAEAYFELFPALRADDELALDVIFLEYILRRDAGDIFSTTEYLLRFADLAERLAMQFDLDGVTRSPHAQTLPNNSDTNGARMQAAGTVIAGRYTLVCEVGEGGMGSVWAAEQTQPVRRRVAVKLIKPGMDSRQVLARFEIERQALAVMDHPNIAKVLDGGATAEGHPYFVMEYVEGQSITEYCDLHRCSVRDRLTLFVKVCQAVQHAHQKGIIHRDLKPSNILVGLQDGEPVPKVIDFGLAKAMHKSLAEHTLYTVHGTIIGTPIYMSPEQAQRNNDDIDTRSDVYSLGVVLYELLTGTTPLARKLVEDVAWPDAVRLIGETEPRRPSSCLESSPLLAAIATQRGAEPAQLVRAVYGDLDWIVLKSLEKDRTRRYQTANGLARDLERFLHDEPVEARSPSVSYRFRKFARRNKVAFFAAGMVAAALLAGITLSTWQAIRATRAERMAHAARLEEAHQRRIAEAQRNDANAARVAEAEQRQLAQVKHAEAEANFQQAQAAVNEYFTLVSESKLLDVPGLQALRKDLLESALTFYEGYRHQRTDDPVLLVDLANTHIRLGQIYLALDRTDDSIASARTALDLIQRVRRDHPTAGEHLRQLAGFWKGRRWSQMVMQPPRNTLLAWMVVVRLETTWKELAEQFPAKIGFQVDLAVIRGLMGGLLSSNERFAEANEYYRQAIAGGEKIIRESPGQPSYRADMAAVCQMLADNLLYTAEVDEALQLTRQAVQLREDLVAELPQTPSYRSALIESLMSLGVQTLPTDSTAAEIAFRRAAQLSQSLIREFPSDLSFLEVWIKATIECAQFEAATRDPALAQQAAQRLFGALDAQVGDRWHDPYIRKTVALALGRLGVRASAQVHPVLCERVLQRSVAIFHKLAVEFPDKVEYARSLLYDCQRLAQLQRDKGESQQAIHTLEVAIAVCNWMDTGYDGNVRELAVALHLEQAMLLAADREAELALQVARKAQEISEKLAVEHPDEPRYRLTLLNVRSVLAGRLAVVGQSDQALEMRLAVIEGLDESEPDFSQNQHTRVIAIRVLDALTDGWPLPMDLRLCEQLNRRKLALQAELAAEFPDDSVYRERLGSAHRSLGWVLHQRGKLEESCRHYRQAADVFATLSTFNLPPRGGFYLGLQADSLIRSAEVALTAGCFNSAVEVAREGVQAYERLAGEFSQQPAVERLNAARHFYALALAVSGSSNRMALEILRLESESRLSSTSQFEALPHRELQ